MLSQNFYLQCNFRGLGSAGGANWCFYVASCSAKQHITKRRQVQARFLRTLQKKTTFFPPDWHYIRQTFSVFGFTKIFLLAESFFTRVCWDILVHAFLTGIFDGHSKNTYFAATYGSMFRVNVHFKDPFVLLYFHEVFSPHDAISFWKCTTLWTLILGTVRNDFSFQFPAFFI